MRYAWNRARSVDAQVVGEMVAGLAEAHGGVCPPQALVEASRSPDAPLHRLFEWDDTVAASAHRRQQARMVVRELRVVEVTDEGEQHMQAFVHVIRMDEDQAREGYRLTRLVVESVDEYAQVLDEALAGLRSWRKRYEHLTELGSVLAVIDEVV